MKEAYWLLSTSAHMATKAERVRRSSCQARVTVLSCNVVFTCCYKTVLIKMKNLQDACPTSLLRYNSVTSICKTGWP